MSSTTHYFAYGSNMAAEQMSDWCAGHRRLGPARLGGWRLAFLRDSPRWLAGAADILPDSDGEVWGVLYACLPEDFDALDAKESVDELGYRRVEVEVEVRAEDPDGARRVRAVTYEVIDAAKASSELAPSRQYLELMLAAAVEVGLPDDYVDALVARLPEAEASRGSR